jgi:hypothetical protein
MSYNRKAIVDALSKMNKARKPKQVNDIIMDPEGQNKFPGLPTRIPSNNITMETTPYPVLGVDNFGNQQMMYPGANYTFPGADYVDEYPMMQIGGQRPILYVDPNDPAGRARYQAYQDSLAAYNFGSGLPQVWEKSDLDYFNSRYANNKGTVKRTVLKPGDKLEYPTHQTSDKSGKKVDAWQNSYKGVNPSNIGRSTLYSDGRIVSNLGVSAIVEYPIYQKPVQPIKYKPDPEVVAKQQQLIDAGYDIGKADGIWGPKSEAAWEEFQKTQATEIEAIPQPTPEQAPTLEVAPLDNTPQRPVQTQTPPQAAQVPSGYNVWTHNGQPLDPAVYGWAPSNSPRQISQFADTHSLKRANEAYNKLGATPWATTGNKLVTDLYKPYFSKQAATNAIEQTAQQLGVPVEQLQIVKAPAGYSGYVIIQTLPQQRYGGIFQSGGAIDWKSRIASTLKFQQGGQLSAEEFAKRKAAYEKLTGRKLEQPKTFKPSEKARQATLDKYNQLPVVQSQPSETVDQSRGIDTKREKEIVEAQANTDAKAAENYMHFYNKTYGSDYGAITYEQALQKVRLPNFDKAKYLNMYNLGQPKNEQLQSFRKEDQANRTWEVITNPFTAFEYAVTTGDMANMPSNINAARMQGYDVGATPGRNMVGNALNMTTNLFDAGDKVVRNVGEGNLLGAGMEALRFLPGARMTTGLGKQAGKYLKLPGSPNNFNLEELRRVYHNNKRFLSPEELKFLHKEGHGKLSRYQNDDFLMTQEQVDRWEKIRNANRNQLQQPPSEIQFMPDGTTRDIYTQQPQPVMPTMLGGIDIRRPINGHAPGTDEWNRLNQFIHNARSQQVNVQNTFDLNKLRKPVNKSGLTKEDALSKASAKDKEIIAKMSNTEFENTVLKPNGEIVIYKPGTDVEQMTYDLGNRKLKLKDAKEMSEKEYVNVFNKNLDLLNDIITKRNKSGINYKVKELTPDGRLIFSTPEQKIPIKLSTKQKTDIESFNKNPEEFLKNRTGLKKEGTKWKMSDEVGGYVFNSIEEAIDFVKKEMKAFTEPKIISGESVWGIKINPGQWKGAVEDITNTEYLRSIPGLEMSNTTSGVFADHVARRGTGAYESINEYLKKLDLGRVKPGFNSQTKFSRGAWENFIKSGKGVGFYNDPNTVYGTMKSLFPYIGAGALGAASQFQEGGTTEEELTPAQLAMMKARLAYAHMHGNPSAQRMVAPVDNPYIFTGNEPYASPDTAGYSGTHYMFSQGPFAVPTIQTGPDGQLYYNVNASPNDSEAMQFDSPEDAEVFARYYKTVAPAFQDMELTDEEIEEYKRGGCTIVKL